MISLHINLNFPLTSVLFKPLMISWIHYLNSSFPFLSLPRINFKIGPYWPLNLILSPHASWILKDSWNLCSFQTYWPSFCHMYRLCSILRFLPETKQFFSTAFPLLIPIHLSDKSWFKCPFPGEALLLSLAMWNPLIVSLLHCNVTFVWLCGHVFLLY